MGIEDVGQLNEEKIRTEQARTAESLGMNLEDFLNAINDGRIVEGFQKMKGGERVVSFVRKRLN